MRVACIVNPQSRGGNGLKVWTKVAEALPKTGWNWEVHFTKRSGHATALALQAVDHGCELVIVVGGNGTVNDVINGLINTRVKLGIIPVGLGNDFARTIAMPQDPIEACVVLSTGKTVKADVGKVGNRYFLNATGVGLDAELALEFGRKRQGTRWLWTVFLLSLLKVFIKFTPRNLLLKYDGIREEIKPIMLTVANGKYVNAGMLVAPQAEICDGFFEICIVEKMTTWEFLQNLPAIYKGKHLSNPAVRFVQAKKVEITATLPQPFQIDGEFGGELPVVIELIPQALEVIVP